MRGLADLGGALMAVIAIQSALLLRAKTGKGQARQTGILYFGEWRPSIKWEGGQAWSGLTAFLHDRDGRRLVVRCLRQALTMLN